MFVNTLLETDASELTGPLGRIRDEQKLQALSDYADGIKAAVASALLECKRRSPRCSVLADGCACVTVTPRAGHLTLESPGSDTGVWPKP